MSSFPSFVLLLLFFYPPPVSPQLNSRIWPVSTREKPLTRYHYEIWVDPRPSDRDNDIYYVEQLEYQGSETDIDIISQVPASSMDWTVQNVVNCTPRAPYVKTFNKYTNFDWTTYDPEYIRVSRATVSSGGQIIETFQEQVLVIFWDYRYRSLRYDFEFEEIPGRPGMVDVIPIPRTALDVELERQTRIWWFTPIVWVDVGAGTYSETTVNDNDKYQAMETNRLRMVFREPNVLYFNFRTWNGYSATTGSSVNGIYSAFQPRTPDDSTFAGLALVCCYEDLSCPQLVPGFQGVSFQLTSCPIPGDRQLSLLSTSVSILEEHAINNRLFKSMYTVGAPPAHVDIELPAGLAFSSWYPWPSLEDSPLSPENGGTLVKRIVFPSSINSIFPLAVDFENDDVIGRQLSVYFKLDGAGAWQLLTVTPRRLSPIPLIPHRIVSAFTWSYPWYYRSMEDYFHLGYNQRSRNEISCTLSSWDEFTPEYRRQNWPPGTTFGPELSLFHKTSAFCEMYRLFGSHSSAEDCVLYRSSTDDSWFPSDMNPGDLVAERTMWQNALDFYVAAGQLARTGDFAYNGILYQQHLKIFGEFLNYTKPEYLNFDIEDYPTKTRFMTHMASSANAQNRRNPPTETDEELFDRIALEFLTDIADVFEEFSPESKVTWYATQSVNNWGNTYSRFGSWDLFDSALGKGRGSSSKLAPQPEMYRQHRSPQVVQDLIRGNRLYLDEGVELIPMPSHGVWGEYSPHLVLDWCIQIFANGGTGFQIYSRSFINDADDLIYTRECVDLVAPYEDVIMDGSVAFRDLFDVSDTLVVGAIRSDDGNEYFVGISPNYQAHYDSWEGQFSLNVPGALFVRVYDARQGQYLVPGADFRLSDDVLTVFFENAPSTVLSVTVENARYTAAFITPIALAVPILLLLAVLVVVLLIVGLKKSDSVPEQPDEKNEGVVLDE